MIKKIYIKYFWFNIVLAIIPLFVVGVVVSFVIRGYIRDNTSQEQVTVLRHSQKVFETMFDNVMALNNTLRFYPSITKKLKNSLATPEGKLSYDDYKGLSDIYDLLFYSVITYDNIDSIYIYYDNPYGNFISNKQSNMSNIHGYHDSNWLDSYQIRPKSDLLWSELRSVKTSIYGEPGSSVYTVYYRLIDSLGKPVGVIACNLNLNEVSKFWNNTMAEFNPSNKANIILLDERNQIIARHLTTIDPDSADWLGFSGWDSETCVIDKKKYMLYMRESEQYPFRYVSMVRTSELFFLSDSIFLITIATTLFTLLAAMWIAIREAKKNYRNLNELYQMITSATKGSDLPPQLPEEDIYALIYNSMLTTLIEQRLIQLRLSEKKYRVLAMNIIALQSQINPHFLFNALESIRWKSIISTNGPNEISETLMELSDILRYSLDSPTSPVELSKEINMLKKYTELQSLRTPGKLETIWDISGDAERCWILKFLIQPILENSIKHAHSPQKEQLLIKILAHVKNGMLIIKITDNGKGLVKKDLTELRDIIYGAAKAKPGRHIGLRNVHQRLRSVYGFGYGVRIGSAYGYGTVTKLALPAMTAQYDIFEASSYWDDEWWLYEE